MQLDFKGIDIQSEGFCPVDVNEWVEKNEIKADWLTPEQIPVKPVYTKEDLEGMEHLGYAAEYRPTWGPIQRCT